MLVSTCFFANNLFSQTLQLSGKVINSRNESLPAASILISPSSKTIITNAEGRYVVDLEIGVKYEFTISSVGYEQKRVTEIEVSKSLDNFLDIVLQESSNTNLETITTRSSPRKLESTNALLSIQKNNTALSSGLAADFIRRTPDKNTGEVLRRVSGASIQDNKFVIIRGLSDRYNAAFINGAALPSSEPDKKAFSFDIIPSSLIDNIIINKTATPDLTGEFAGGIVQIQTKDIPTSNQLMVGASVGFNTQSAFKNFTSNQRGSTDWLGFDNQRGLPSSYPLKTGDYERLSGAEKTNVSRDLKNQYNEVGSKAGPITNYNLTWANVKRYNNGMAVGSVLGVTYRTSKLLYDASRIFYEGQSSQVTVFDYNDAQNKYSVTWGGVANIAWSYKKHKIAFKNLFNQLFEDNYYTRTGTSEVIQDVVLRSSVLNQRSLYSAQLEGTHQFTSRNIKFNWNLNYAFNNKQQPDLRVQSYIKPIGATDPFSVNLRGNNTNRFFSGLTDNVFGYNASLSIPFDLGTNKQIFKIGGSSTARLRDFRATILGYDEPSNQSLALLPYNQIFSSPNINDAGGFLLNTDLQNPSDKYYGASILTAGFFMFDNKISDKLRLVWGSRFEYFEQFLKTNKIATDKAEVVNTDKFDFLPSVNLTYSVTNKANLRLAGSRTVARPEFREIANFAFFDFEQIASFSGNPELQRSAIINADARYEWYPKSGEVVSLGAFYKNFNDPIELRLVSSSTASRRQYQYQNAEKATLFGLEAEFRKSLSFLSSASWLENFYFNGNVSLIFSEVSLGNRDVDGNKLPATKRPLQGQSPYLINAGFQYDGPKGTNMSLLYNRIGQRLYLVGNEFIPDLYEQPRNLVDFQLTQKVFDKKGEIRFTVSDIFNQYIGVYANNDKKLQYKEGTDWFYSKYKPGSTFTIGFNYNFDFKK